MAQAYLLSGIFQGHLWHNERKNYVILIKRLQIIVIVIQSGYA
jgi:hypothetical protein